MPRYRIPLSARNVLLSIGVIAVGWSVPWLVWWDMMPPAVAAPRARLPLQVAYVRAAGGPEGAAGSPVLFSLPERYGFSDVVRDKREDAVHFLKPQLPGDAYLPGGPSESTATARVASAGMVPPLAQERYRPPPVDGRPYAPSAAPTSGVQVTLSGDLVAAGFDAPDVRAERLFAGVPAWTLFRARVEVGPTGRTAHVFLEQSTGKADVDDALIKALYKGNVQRRGSACTGTVKIAYLGSAGAAGASEGGTP